MGKAMLAMARVVGPRRMLLRMPNSVKSGSNFAQLDARELAPNEFLLTSQPYMGYGEFMQGSVSAAIDISGAKTARSRSSEYDRPAEKLVLARELASALRVRPLRICDFPPDAGRPALELSRTRDAMNARLDRLEKPLGAK